MSRIELHLTNLDQINQICKLIEKWNIDASMYTKEGDIYAVYQENNSLPASCKYSVLPPTKDKMLECDTWMKPSEYLKGYLGKEYLNKYGYIRKRGMYTFLNEQIRIRGLPIFGEIVYLDNYMQSILQTRCGSMSFVEIYQKIDENLISI
jgi:hypothetical protein